MDTATLFKLIQLLSIGMLFGLYLYAKLQKPSEMQKYVSMLSLNMILMLLGYLMEMEAKTLEGAYYGTIVSYVGSPFMMVSMLLFTRTFYGKRTPKPAYFAMMFVALTVTTLVATNSYHHLYYSCTGYDAFATYSPLVLEHGPLYGLNLATIAFYNVAIIATTTSALRNKSLSSVKRKLSIYALLMILCTISGFILYFLNVADGYDTTMFGLTGSTICLAIMFFRCKAFDVVDMAKDYALEISPDGLMIFDENGEMVYRNSAAEKVIGAEVPKQYADQIPDVTDIYKQDEHVYSVSAHSISRGEDYLGKSVEIHDITESYYYSERLEAAVEAAKDQLEMIQRTILGSFASLVEARSLETGDHIKRVSRYTEIIAQQLKEEGKYTELLTDDYITMLVYSSPLHDVGKISISDTILLKPGKLTTEEFEEMKKHSRIGSDVIHSTMEGLESEEYVNLAAEIALYHHERWDGRGYPTGLKGEEIPLSARIVAVADCYDAMTSQRCYKDAYPDSKAIGILLEESGTHFDPEIVTAFVNYQGKL